MPDPESLRQATGYQRLWAGTVASNLGDGMVVAAFPLLAATVTTDPVAISGLTAAAGLPWLLLGPVSGAIVDRFDRRRLMWTFDILRALLVAGLALQVAFGDVSLIVLYAVVALITVGETIVDTASQAILPSLVPHNLLDSANGRLFSTMTVANRFLGPPLGGFLFGVAVVWPIALDAASFALAGLLVAGIGGSHRPAPAAVPTSVRSDVVEGMRWLWTNRPIRAFAIGAAVLNIGILAGESILVLFVTEQLGLGATGFGALFVATAAGYAAGSFVAPRATRRFGRFELVMAAVGLVIIALAVVAAAPHWIVAAAGLTAIGLASGVWDVIAVSYRQAAVPDRLLGRIMAAYRVIAHGSIPVGAFLGGFTAQMAGNRAAFLVGAAVVATAPTFLVPALRGVELDPSRAGTSAT